jgi:energy-converting hydrogenase Eha subunit F
MAVTRNDNRPNHTNCPLPQFPPHLGNITRRLKGVITCKVILTVHYHIVILMCTITAVKRSDERPSYTRCPLPQFPPHLGNIIRRLKGVITCKVLPTVLLMCTIMAVKRSDERPSYTNCPLPQFPPHLDTITRRLNGVTTCKVLPTVLLMCTIMAVKRSDDRPSYTNCPVPQFPPCMDTITCQLKRVMTCKSIPTAHYPSALLVCILLCII